MPVSQNEIALWEKKKKGKGKKRKGKERLILPWKKMAFLWNNKQSLNSTSLKWMPSFPFIKMTVCRHILQLEGDAAAGDSFKNRPNLENDSNVSQMLYPPNLACEALKRAVTFFRRFKRVSALKNAPWELLLPAFTYIANIFDDKYCKNWIKIHIFSPLVDYGYRVEKKKKKEEASHKLWVSSKAQE